MDQGREACYSAEETFTRDYKMMMTLGQGNFAKVKLAFHIPTVTCVAVKMIRNQKTNPLLIHTEIKIMKSIVHANIIKLFHVVQTRTTTYLVMEHASEGELLKHIREQRFLRESEACRLFTQILSAVQYCHNNHIVHRDIKASNILIDCKGNAKLGDFGLAVNVMPGQRLKGLCGTLPYCAPEVLGDEAYDGPATDIWSLGVLFFLMVAGHLPFQGNSFVEVRQQIFSVNFNVPKHVSIDIFNVIVSLLIVNPDRRPAISQIMRSPMIRDSEAHSPPTSTQSLPGTLSPSIVKTMKVMGYKSDDIMESLRDQKYNQVMATYLILQHQSPGGDFCHQKVKAIQPGLAFNLADRHTFHVPLRRALETSPSTFTVQSKPQKEEEKKKARQCGTRHRMPATMCCLPKRILPLHLGCPVNYCFVESNLEINTTFTQSKISVGSSQMVTAHTFKSMANSFHRSDQNETIGGTGNNMSFFSAQEELWFSVEEAQYENLRASSRMETLKEDITIHKEAITQEKTMNQEATARKEEAINKEVTISQEGIMTQEQPQDGIPDSSENRRRRNWKGVKKRIVNCLRHLCCCLPPAKKSQRSRDKQEPKREDLADPVPRRRSSPSSMACEPYVGDRPG